MQNYLDSGSGFDYFCAAPRKQKNMTTCTYLTENQMSELIANCKELRKGHKLIGNRKNFTVIVDGEHHEIATEKALRNFLSVCVFPKNFRFFRNADKGVTINLD